MSDTAETDLGTFLFTAAGRSDPYPEYERLRELAPVHDTGSVQYVTRYDDVVSCMRDPGRFSSDAMGGGARDGTRMIIATDPPEHTKLRRLVTRPFRPGAIAALEPRIRDLAEELVDDLIAANARGAADLIDHLGAPLPVVVIAEMLGIPAERRDEFRRWSDDAVGGMGFNSAGDGITPMGAFFAEVIAERRADPGDDLISLLVTGNEPLSDPEVIMFCVTLLIAGNETTTNLVGNTAAALFANPEQAERLWAEPDLIPSAVEEVLRYDAPVQVLLRRATASAKIGGTTLPGSSTVLLGVASANRDPRHFDAPDVFDVARAPTDHIAFGSGVHLCLGAPLARLEATIVLETLVARIRNLRPTGDARRRRNPLLRGFHSLPVAFDRVG